MLDTRHFVSRGAVVLGELAFDHDLRIEFVRDHEIRSLVKAFQTLGAPGLAVANVHPRRRSYSSME